MQQQQRKWGQGRGYDHQNKGRCGQGGRGQDCWQKKMLIKLAKDEDAKFRPQVEAFLEGMFLFDSKAELLTLLEDDHNFGTRRIHDCLSMINGPDSADSILTPLLTNIINEETGRSLYKAPRDNLMRAVFATPGFVEFLATRWSTHMDQSSPKTVESIAKYFS